MEEGWYLLQGWRRSSGDNGLCLVFLGEGERFHILGRSLNHHQNTTSQYELAMTFPGGKLAKTVGTRMHLLRVCGRVIRLVIVSHHAYQVKMQYYFGVACPNNVKCTCI